jgi:hypothetical protein
MEGVHTCMHAYMHTHTQRTAAKHQRRACTRTYMHVCNLPQQGMEGMQSFEAGLPLRRPQLGN